VETTRVTVDGSGDIGELGTWSVSENATPVAPGDPAAASGGVQFEAQADENSDFLTGDSYTLADENYGTVSGAITRADVGILGVSATGDNLITRLSAVRTVPPGGVVLNQTLEDRPVDSPAGWVNSSSTVSPFNNRVYSISWNVARISIHEQDGTFVGFFGGGSGTGNGQFGARIAAFNVRFTFNPANGDLFIPDPSNNRVQVFSAGGTYLRQIAVPRPISTAIRNGVLYIGCEARVIGGDDFASVFTTPVAGGSVTQIGPGDSSFNGQGVRWMILTEEFILVICFNWSFTISYSGTRSPRRDFTSNPDSGDFALIQSVTYQSPSVIVGWDRIKEQLVGGVLQQTRVSGNVTLTSPYRTDWSGGYFLSTTPTISELVVNNSQTLARSTFSTFEDGTLPFFTGIDRNYQRRSFLAPRPSLSELVQRYLESLNAGLTLDYQATEDPYIAAPGWSDSVWTKLNELCVAYNVEIGIVGQTIVVRDIGTGTLETEDFTPISRSISMDGASRYVDIQYTNARAGVGVVYDASKDGQGRTFEVDTRETKTEPIQTQNFPVALQQPDRTNTFPVQPGQYYLVGSDNLPVAPNQFEVYGGSVTVSVSTTVPGGLYLNLTGPLVPIPGVPGPYRLAISDGSTTYPAFSVVGAGVFANPQNVRMSTGADWNKVTSDVNGQALSNTFLATRAQAWDRGRWAAVRASGPNVSIAFSLSSENSNGFGLTAGSTFEAYEAVWRVDSVSFGAAGFQVQASLYTTFGDVQPVWDDETIGDFASGWDGKKIKDFRVRPLANAVD
jgi:hypothetical protein